MKKTKILLEDDNYEVLFDELINTLQEALDDDFVKVSKDYLDKIRKASKAAGSYALETLGENPDFETAENNLKGEFSLYGIPDEKIDFDVFKRVIGAFVKNDETILMVVPGKIFVYPNLESVETKLREMGYLEVKDKEVAEYLSNLIELYSEINPLPVQAKILVVQTYSEEKREKEKKNSTGQPGEV